MQARHLAVSLAISTVLCAASGAYAQDLAKRLVGAWRLVSTEQRLTDGTVRPNPLFESNGVGYLVYTDSGIVCAVLANHSRTPWKSEDSPSDIELRSAADHFVAYCGQYDVNEQRGFVICHVEIDMVPNCVGTDCKRFFALDGNRLKLRPAEPLPKGVVDYTLTWERVNVAGVPAVTR